MKITRQRVAGRTVYRDTAGRFRSRADWQSYWAERRATEVRRAAPVTVEAEPIRRQRVAGRIVYRDTAGRFRSRADWRAFRAEYRRIVRERVADRTVYRDDAGMFRGRGDWAAYRSAYLEGWVDYGLDTGDEIEVTVTYKERK